MSWWKKQLADYPFPTSSVTSMVLTLTASPAPASSLILILSTGVSINSITDSVGNTGWTTDVLRVTPESIGVCSLLTMTTPLASGDTVTVALAGNATPAALLEEYHSLTATDGTSSNGTGAGTSTSIAPGAVTTTNAADIAVTGLFAYSPGDATGLAVDSGYTIRESVSANSRLLYLADREFTATATTDPTWSWTTSQKAGAALAAYQKGIPAFTPTEMIL